jgi:DNA repair protein RadC
MVTVNGPLAHLSRGNEMTATAAQRAWATRRARAAASTAPVPAAVPGFSEASLAMLDETELLSLFRAAGRLVEQKCLRRRPVLSSWSTMLDYLRSVMAFEPREQFRILFLDKRNNLIGDELQSTGTVDHVPVYPREVARRAIEMNATAIILTHNHPSGDPTPSRADVEMTKACADALRPLGIAVHDHIIIGRDGHSSLKALKLF